MDDIKELLETEITDEMDKLSDLELGSNEYKVAVEGITKLMDKRIDLAKLENDATVKNRDYELDKRKIDSDIADKSAGREIENKKLEQITNDKNDQIIKNGIAIAGIVIPSLITIWGTFKTLKFEETGTVTTIMGKGFVNKLIPKK